MKMLLSIFSFILVSGVSSAHAVDSYESAICKQYAKDRNYSGERRQRSLDVCNAAVDSLVSLGQMDRRSSEKEPATHLNRVCGVSGDLFRLGNPQPSADFLEQFQINLSNKGYSFTPNDYQSIYASLVEEQETDLFVRSNFSEVNCSTLLYVLFRVENYARKSSY